MRVLFTTNFPSPYRVDFFNELGKYCELTVLYERKEALHRDKQWIGGKAETYKEKYLNLKPIGTSQSLGFDIIKYISNGKYDFIIFSGYASPSVMIAIQYCKIFNIDFYIEYDGGFFQKDTWYKRLIKKGLVKAASGHFITCKETENYLESLGVEPSKLWYYPFSSLKESEILDVPLLKCEKKIIKQELGIEEDYAIISVGRFIPIKGFDVLLNALDFIDPNVGVYIIGGQPTEEYLSICKEKNLQNVNFVPFCSKSEIFKWYKAGDLMVFPTRKDVWGLVVNEAMACGLPIVSSDMSIAARELIVPEENGLIFRSEDVSELVNCINKQISTDNSVFANNNLMKIRNYTIEAMVKTHIDVLTAIFEYKCNN